MLQVEQTCPEIDGIAIDPLDVVNHGTTDQCTELALLQTQQLVAWQVVVGEVQALEV